MSTLERNSSISDADYMAGTTVDEANGSTFMAEKAAAATFASGRRHNRVYASNSAGGGSNAPQKSSNLSVLRYRTDLDKAVIHFMFERYHLKCEEVVVDYSNPEERYSDTAVGPWNFFWMSVVRIRSVFSAAEFRLQDNQIINHFPNHYELTRKDLMYKNIKRYLRDMQLAGKTKNLELVISKNWSRAMNTGTGGARYVDPNGAGNTTVYAFADSVPITYNLPNDMSMFIEEFKRNPGASWIVKPTARSQGKGIFIVNRIQQLTRWMKDKKEAERESMNHAGIHPGCIGAGLQTSSSSPPLSKDIQSMLGAFIVSKYIANPLLIGQRKFDLRLYVLVTSFKPLVAYLHREGFARFCATRYEGGNFSDDSLGSHLTNVALQKGDEHYNTTHGGKWSYRNVILYIQSRYGAYAAEAFTTSVEFLIFHSLKAMENVMFNDKHSFELYGYDILIDEHVRPHLIEVNASPSLSVTTTSDRLIKEEVLGDTVKIAFPPGFPNNKSFTYWDYRLRTDLTTKIKTGFKLLQF